MSVGWDSLPCYGLHFRTLDIAHRLEMVRIMIQKLKCNVFMLSYRGSVLLARFLSLSSLEFLIREQNIPINIYKTNIVRDYVTCIGFPLLRRMLCKELHDRSPVNVTTSEPCIHMHPAWKLHKGALRVTGSRFGIQHFHVKWRDHLILQPREEKYRLFDLFLFQNQLISELLENQLMTHFLASKFMAAWSLRYINAICLFESISNGVCKL